MKKKVEAICQMDQLILSQKNETNICQMNFSINPITTEEFLRDNFGLVDSV